MADIKHVIWKKVGLEGRIGDVAIKVMLPIPEDAAFRDRFYERGFVGARGST